MLTILQGIFQSAHLAFIYSLSPNYKSFHDSIESEKDYPKP